MTEERDWLAEWRDMMCSKMDACDQWCFSDYRLRCETPDGVVTCDECRYYNDTSNKLGDDE